MNVTLSGGTTNQWSNTTRGIFTVVNYSISDNVVAVLLYSNVLWRVHVLLDMERGSSVPIAMGTTLGSMMEFKNEGYPQHYEWWYCIGWRENRWNNHPLHLVVHDYILNSRVIPSSSFGGKHHDATSSPVTAPLYGCPMEPKYGVLDLTRRTPRHFVLSELHSLVLSPVGLVNPEAVQRLSSLFRGHRYLTLSHTIHMYSSITFNTSDMSVCQSVSQSVCLSVCIYSIQMRPCHLAWLVHQRILHVGTIRYLVGTY